MDIKYVCSIVCCSFTRKFCRKDMTTFIFFAILVPLCNACFSIDEMESYIVQLWLYGNADRERNLYGPYKDVITCYSTDCDCKSNYSCPFEVEDCCEHRNGSSKPVGQCLKVHCIEKQTCTRELLGYGALCSTIPSRNVSRS